jgi:hypothetical protein
LAQERERKGVKRKERKKLNTRQTKGKEERKIKNQTN